MQYPVTSRNKITRAKERGDYDKEAVFSILDAGKICDVGFAVDEQPFVIPMAYARVGETLILHGGVASRLSKLLATGISACVTITLLDGLVLARSTFSHSLNFRSVVAFGTARLIEDEQEKLEALDQLVEFLSPGRVADCRRPNKKELNAPLVLAFDIDQASAKIRSGGPNDAKGDMDEKVWAGTVPITQVYGDWIPSDDLKAGIDLPAYQNKYKQP